MQGPGAQEGRGASRGRARHRGFYWLIVVRRGAARVVRGCPGVWDSGLLLSPAGGSPAGEGRSEHGRIEDWKPGSGIPAHLAHFPDPFGEHIPGGRGYSCLSSRGGTPRTCSAGRPFSGPFVPGKPDAPTTAAPARCLFQCQLSGQLLSPHNGVRTRPPGFGSGKLPCPPHWAEDAQGMRYFGERKTCFPWDSIRAGVCGLHTAHPRASSASSSSGQLRLCISRLFIGGSMPGVG